MKNDEAKAILKKYLGDFEENPIFGMMQGMKIDMLASMAEDMFSEKMIFSINKKLTKIKKIIYRYNHV